MADDQDFETWDDEFLEKAIQLTEAAVCSSSSNPTQLPPPPQQPFPPPPPPYSAPHISYSPPRELSQRVKEDNFRNFSDKGFDCPVSLNGINHSLNSVPSFPHSSRLRDEDKCLKQQEINRLKEELGRVSKELTNLEQECSELRKERDKNEKHLRLVIPINGSKEAEAPCTYKSNLKNKVPIEDHSIVHPGFKGIVPCKAVGVQTDEHATSPELTIKKNYPLRKLASIWEPPSDQKPRTNLVSKLFVACEADLQVLFGCLGSNISSKRTKTKMGSSKHNFSYMAPDHCIQAVDPMEVAKVSHFYFTLTKISYDTVRLDDLLEALVDLCCLQNMMIVHRSLCVLHVVLKHILSIENKSRRRDNIVIKNPSDMNKSSEVGHLSCENTGEMSNPQHSILTRLISAKKVWNKDGLRDDSSQLISCSKWFCIFQLLLQVITRHNEGVIRLEAISIMNIILLRTNAFEEREMYGQLPVFQSISQLLRKEAGLGVQKQAVHLLYLLLNCPNLMAKFCSSCNEEGTTAELLTTNAKTAPAFEGLGAILDGIADCLACCGNGAPTILVLKLQRNTIILLAFLASSGRHGFELFLGHNLPKRTNFLYLILKILASEIDVEASECIQASEFFRERTLLIREALILLNRLASNSQYSTPVLRVLTNRRDMACLTVDIASRLSRKGKWLWQSDTMTTQMRESEIVDLARIFKKRVFTFLGDSTSEK